MNEQLKQIAIKAQVEHCISHVRLQEFAKLIVEECMNQVKEQYVPVLEDKEMMKDTHWDGYVQCGVDSVVGIREYFFGEAE